MRGFEWGMNSTRSEGDSVSHHRNIRRSSMGGKRQGQEG